MSTEPECLKANTSITEISIETILRQLFVWRIAAEHRPCHGGAALSRFFGGWPTISGWVLNRHI